jgi:hypothetical protein
MKIMKTKLFLTAAMIGAATLSTQAGVEVTIAVPVPVVVVAPVIMVPEVYTWDGYENVGIVDGQYFYLGPGDVWLACDPDRLTRFHGWERGHADWQTHAIRNDRYRNDAHGNAHPVRHDGPEKADAQPVRHDAPEKVKAQAPGQRGEEKGGDKAAPSKDEKRDKQDDKH